MRGFFLTAAGYLRLFNWFSLRHLRDHWVRALTVLLGIALGAAVFTSVRIAVHATLNSFSRSMEQIAGKGDLTLVRPGGRVPDRLVAALMNLPAVQTASPVLSAYVRTADQESPFLLMGIDPILDRDLRNWSVRSIGSETKTDWLSMVTQPNGLIITGPLGGLLGWREGQRVKMVHSRQTAQFTILGALDTEGLALVEGGRIALCDIATFQEFTGLFGLADRIDVKLTDPEDMDAITSVEAILPAGVLVQSPSALTVSGRSMIRAYEISLTFLSFISLFVGMFLVFSLVALNAAARRRELAVMRATGASERLLFFLFVGEGAVIGLVGWLLALPLSGLLVKHLLAGVSQTVSMLFVRVQVDQLFLSPWEILLSFGVTLAVAILAALQPAREAMGVPPQEALDIDPSVTLQPGLLRKMAWTGIAFLLLVYPVTRLPTPPSVSVPGYLAALLLFVGFSLLAPLLLRQVGRLLRQTLFRLGGQPAFLAAGYLKESGVQTAISVGALITAVALFTALVVMIHSFRSTVALWVQQSIAGDLYIRPKLAELNRFRDPLPPSVANTLKKMPDSIQTIPMHRLELRMNGHQHLFEAMDYHAYAKRSRFVWMGGDIRQIEADLSAGKGVVVSEVFANNTGLNAGDRYRVRIRDQLLDEPIVGVFRDYRTRGGTVYYSLARYQQRFKDPTWSGVQVNIVAQGRDRSAVFDRVRNALLSCCADSIEMTEGQKLRLTILRIFDETFAITTVLLLIALVVAALGIATTLAVLVLQRRVQISTIRALGGSASQLRRMIAWEASLIVLVGQGTGLICGFLLSLILIFVVNLQSFGWTFLYVIDWKSLLTALPLIFAAAMLAALPAVKLALQASPAMLLREGSR